MRPIHMLWENWKPLQNPERDSLWNHHLAGRVLLLLLSRSCPSGSVMHRVVGAGGAARSCADERGGRLPERCHAPQCGETPLHRAAQRGHVAVVEQLLAAGAAVEAKDQVGVGTRIGEGWRAERSLSCLLGFLALCFLSRLGG